MLGPLTRMAKEKRVGILTISRFRKGEGRAVHQTMGSLAFVAAARVAWAITRCPVNKRRRLFTCIKNNLADDTSGLAYSVEPYGQNGEPVICWESEPVRMTAEEAMNSRQQRKPGPSPDEREEAADWLREQFAKGPKPAKDILSEADAVGFNERTVRRAFKQIGGKCEKRGFTAGWLWRLPQDDTQPVVSNNLSSSYLRLNPEENTLKKKTKHTLPAKVTDCKGDKYQHRKCAVDG